MPMIAALFVDARGCYADYGGVELWDKERDARTYPGPWPVVAHPPCARWSSLAFLVQAQYGYRVGDDGGCFASALASVRKWGGVLEHPAQSAAWPWHGLPAHPPRGGWARTLLDDGWVTEVSQGAYGHPAAKRTWLYYVGVTPPLALDWSEPDNAVTVSDLGAGGSRRRGDEWVNGSKGVQYRRAEATPPRFRDVLIDLAIAAVPQLALKIA